MVSLTTSDSDLLAPELSEEVQQYLGIDHEAVVAARRSEGFEIIEGTPDTLLLDLDTPEDVAHFEKWFAREVCDLGIVVTIKARYKSKSATPGKPGHEHVILRVEPPIEDPLKRICFQLLFGSDRKREFLAYENVKTGRSYPIVLFKPPAQKSVAVNDEVIL